MIPSGAGWAHHSMTRENNVDLHATIATARWAPQYQGTSGTPAFRGESVNPTLRRLLSTGPQTAASAQRFFRFDFQHTDIDADCQINERPGECWGEFELDMKWQPVGTTDTWRYFEIVTENGLVMFRNIGVTSGNVVLRSAIEQTSMGAANQDFNNDWSANLIRTVRWHYTPSTSPGVTSNGTLEVYSSVGSHGNGDTLSFASDLSASWTHFGGPIKWFLLGCQNANAYTATPTITNATYTHATRTLATTESMAAVINGQSFNATGGTVTAGQYVISTHGANSLVLAGDGLGAGSDGATDIDGNVNSPCDVGIRNFCWGTTDPATGDGVTTPSSGMSGATPWFVQCGGYGAPHIGIQDQGTTSGIKVRVEGFYDANQFEIMPAPTTDDVTAEIQWGTDPTFASITTETGVTFNTTNSPRYAWAATIDNMAENTTYYVRVKYTNSATINEYFTSAAKFTTVSRNLPTIIKIGHGSCMRMTGDYLPMSVFDVLGADSPHLLCVGGDTWYPDSADMFTPATVAAYAAAGANAAARQLLQAQYLTRALIGNCQFEKAACRMSTVIRADDHDSGLNGFAGASVDPVDFTSGNGLLLRNEFENEHQVFYTPRMRFDVAPSAAGTVRYNRMRTAKCEIVILDTRRHFDRNDAGADATTVLGTTQKNWATDGTGVITTTTKPILILVSGQPWTTNNLEPLDGWGNSAATIAERNLLLSTAETNTAIKHIVLLSSDRHNAVVIPGSEFTASTKVLWEISCSPFNNDVIAVADYWTGTLSYSTAFGKTGTLCARSYCLLTIDEATLRVTVAIKSLTGTTTNTTASTLFSQSAGGGGGRLSRLGNGRAQRLARL